MPSWPARLDDVRDLEGACLADDVAHRGRAEHDLDGRDHARLIDAAEERLRDDRLQRVREHRPDLVLLAVRVHIDDSLDRLRRVDGVQGREHQVTGFGGADRESGRLKVSHFADQDDVRILTEGVLEAA
jgi:hypothetical protein